MHHSLNLCSLPSQNSLLMIYLQDFYPLVSRTYQGQPLDDVHSPFAVDPAFGGAHLGQDCSQRNKEVQSEE